MEDRPPRVREIAGSITCRVLPKTFKKIVVAALLGALVCGVSITADVKINGPVVLTKHQTINLSIKHFWKPPVRGFL